jgi:ankyrin repeat protein
MVELLAAAGANVNATSNYGDTPLHLCVTSCNVEAAQTLLRAGANPAISNHKGLTPLAKARQNDCAPLVRVLQDS